MVLVLIAGAMSAFGRGRAGMPFDASRTALALAVVDVQVMLGIVLYVAEGWWEGDALIGYVHPGLMLLALLIGHALLGRARRVRMAADAYRFAGRGLVIALVLIVAGIGVASV